jgi:hypothetical protein
MWDIKYISADLLVGWRGCIPPSGVQYPLDGIPYFVVNYTSTYYVEMIDF